MTTSEAPRLHDELRAAGLKATPQRIEVLTILRRSDKHLDAEGIHQTALGRGADISLATVYRTLGALKEAGLVEPRALARDQNRDDYEAADRPDHHHFTCQQCGQVLCEGCRCKMRIHGMCAAQQCFKSIAAVRNGNG